MISTLGTLDWSRFLSRPLLPSPSTEVLDALHGLPSLITGAGGSIGSALAQRVAGLAPSSLLLLDSSQARLSDLQQSLAPKNHPRPVTFVLGNVDDPILLRDLFASHAPRIIFHAAALKHVPLLEEQPLAAIANNIFGTLTLTRAASDHNARVVLLSTDKAVDPSSIMGATKRVAEFIVLAAGGTVLRLGNVLATRDSVVEVFACDIAAGRRLSITSPAARRYFLTLDEAVNLLLIAAAAPGSGLILAPQINSQHFITDLAHFMAAELAPHRIVEIDFIGLRPGDKESERFCSASESLSPPSNPGLLSIHSPRPDNAQLASALAALQSALHTRDLPAALDVLCALVAGYAPSATVQSQATQRVAS